MMVDPPPLPPSAAVGGALRLSIVGQQHNQRRASAGDALAYAATSSAVSGSSSSQLGGGGGAGAGAEPPRRKSPREELAMQAQAATTATATETETETMRAGMERLSVAGAAAASRPALERLQSDPPPSATAAEPDVNEARLRAIAERFGEMPPNATYPAPSSSHARGAAAVPRHQAYSFPRVGSPDWEEHHAMDPSEAIANLPADLVPSPASGEDDRPSADPGLVDYHYALPVPPIRTSSSSHPTSHASTSPDYAAYYPTAPPYPYARYPSSGGGGDGSSPPAGAYEYLPQQQGPPQGYYAPPPQHPQGASSYGGMYSQSSSPPISPIMGYDHAHHGHPAHTHGGMWYVPADYARTSSSGSIESQPRFAYAPAPMPDRNTAYLSMHQPPPPPPPHQAQAQYSPYPPGYMPYHPGWAAAAPSPYMYAAAENTRSPYAQWQRFAMNDMDPRQTFSPRGGRHPTHRPAQHRQPPLPRSVAPHQTPSAVGLGISSDHLTTAGTAIDGGAHSVERKSYHPAPPANRSEWVMWVGNVPANVTHEEMWKFFNAPLDLPGQSSIGVTSIFLITRSSCAFVNLKSSEDLDLAIAYFNGKSLRPWDPRCPKLVCRVRKTDDDLRSGVGAQRGAGMHTRYVKAMRGKENVDVAAAADMPLSPVPASPAVCEPPPEGEGRRRESIVNNLPAGISPAAFAAWQKERSQSGTNSHSFASTNSSFLIRNFPKRYFILKSLTQDEFDVSMQTGLWSTQPHNEPILDQAFRTSPEVFLIFGANKKGCFCGYAIMRGPIRPSKSGSSKSKDSGVDLSGVPFSVTSPGELGAGEELPEYPLHPLEPPKLSRENTDGVKRQDMISSSPNGIDTKGPRQFKIEWVRKRELPFHRIRHLRNPWNQDKEVKVSRDGTELEPTVGDALLNEWDKLD